MYVCMYMKLIECWRTVNICQKKATNSREKKMGNNFSRIAHTATEMERNGMECITMRTKTIACSENSKTQNRSDRENT